MTPYPVRDSSAPGYARVPFSFITIARYMKKSLVPALVSLLAICVSVPARRIRSRQGENIRHDLIDGQIAFDESDLPHIGEQRRHPTGVEAADLRALFRIARY